MCDRPTYACGCKGVGVAVRVDMDVGVNRQALALLF